MRAHLAWTCAAVLACGADPDDVAQTTASATGSGGAPVASSSASNSVASSTASTASVGGGGSGLGGGGPGVGGVAASTGGNASSGAGGGGGGARPLHIHFDAAQLIAPPVSAASLAVGSINADGAVDLVVGSSHGSSEVRLGNGDATFQPPITTADGSFGVQALGLADFDGDGILDAAAAHMFDLADHAVSVQLGAGDGTFGSPVYAASVGQPDGIAVGRLNADPYPDVAVAKDAGSVDVFLGNGDGSLSLAGSYGYSNSCRAVALGDLNGDGNADLILGETYQLTTFVGNGDGTFQGPGVHPYPGFATNLLTSLGVGDFDEDGLDDVVVPLDGGLVDLLVSNGNGTVSLSHQSKIGSGNVGAAVADFDGDGHLDVAVLSETSFEYGGDLSVLRGDGTGHLELVACAAVPSSFRMALTSADVNGDGKPDLLVATVDGVFVLLNTSSTDRGNDLAACGADPGACQIGQGALTVQDCVACLPESCQGFWSPGPYTCAVLVASPDCGCGWCAGGCACCACN